MSEKHLLVLGIRGVPARHGGFETFAEKLSIFLVARGWRVTVYCQEEGCGVISESIWQGIRRVHVPVRKKGPLGTVIFDWKSVLHSLSEQGLLLTLGYNTSVFNLLQRFKRKTNIINMDGIEWKRDKWGVAAKSWFWLNERAGCWFGTHLVADHPDIEKHLATRVSRNKIDMIPYGADEVVAGGLEYLERFSLIPDGYSLVVARPEPENNILQMVKAFSSRSRGHKLVVLGSYILEENTYHKDIVAAASDEVMFPGAIYDQQILTALRFYARFYFHGHTVGGTNPSLVEALGAGNAVIAHDNKFNRWVSRDGAVYFKNLADLMQILDESLSDVSLVASLRRASKRRFKQQFTWVQVLSEYERLLKKWHRES